LTDLGKKCLVIDKRNHIGGNSFSSIIEGIECHKYGVHIFHTKHKYIWDYVKKFSEFNNYRHKVKVFYKGTLFSFPINLMTLQQLWGVVTPEEAVSLINKVKIRIDDPKNMEEWLISQVGYELYDIFYKGYNEKHWHKDPKDLPAAIAKRVPIRFTYNEDYFDDPYQGLPVQGYEAFFKNMLQGIDIQLNTDFLKNRGLTNSAKRVIYTGKIDEYYDYSLGRLGYINLDFETKVVSGDFQGTPIVNYTDYAIPYSRIAEYKHITGNPTNSSESVIVKEYSRDTDSGIPCYPINTKDNNDLFTRYLNMETNTIFGGRLGSYKYQDMDNTVELALKLVKEIKGTLT